MEYSNLYQEDLSNFAVLPDELLIQTCEEMDDRTLGRFTSVYQRAANVCSDIIEDRKRKATIIREIVNDILKSGRSLTWFTNTINGITVNIIIDKRGFNEYIIRQFIYANVESASKIAWIAPALRYKEALTFSGSIERYTGLIDKSILPSIVRHLYEQGYRRSIT